MPKQPKKGNRNSRNDRMYSTTADDRRERRNRRGRSQSPCQPDPTVTAGTLQQGKQRSKIAKGVNNNAQIALLSNMIDRNVNGVVTKQMNDQIGWNVKGNVKGSKGCKGRSVNQVNQVKSSNVNNVLNVASTGVTTVTGDDIALTVDVPAEVDFADFPSDGEMDHDQLNGNDEQNDSIYDEDGNQIPGLDVGGRGPTGSVDCDADVAAPPAAISLENDPVFQKLVEKAVSLKMVVEREKLLAELSNKGKDSVVDVDVNVDLNKSSENPTTPIRNRTRNIIKSPLDTTIYVPGLQQRSDITGHGGEMIDRISNFVERLRLETEL